MYLGDPRLPSKPNIEIQLLQWRVKKGGLFSTTVFFVALCWILMDLIYLSRPFTEILQTALDFVGSRSCHRICSCETCSTLAHTSHWRARWNIPPAFARGGRWWRSHRSSSWSDSQIGKSAVHQLDANVCRSSAMILHHWKDVGPVPSTIEVQLEHMQHPEGPTFDARCTQFHRLQVCLHFCPSGRTNSAKARLWALAKQGQGVCKFCQKPGFTHRSREMTSWLLAEHMARAMAFVPTSWTCWREASDCDGQMLDEITWDHMRSLFQPSNNVPRSAPFRLINNHHFTAILRCWSHPPHRSVMAPFMAPLVPCQAAHHRS